MPLRLPSVSLRARGRRGTALAVGSASLAVVVGFGLSGCSSPAPAASADPSDIVVTGTPIAIGCDELVPASALTGLWAGYTLDAAAEPSKVAAEIAGYDGLVCTLAPGADSRAGAEPIEFAVAQLEPDVIEALKNEMFRTSKAVPSYGTPKVVEGYFTAPTAETAGTAHVFVDDFWIEAASADFVEPGDPTPLVAAAIAALTNSLVE